MYRNRAKCKNCGDVIESKHGHDWVSCTCFQEGEKAVSEYQDEHYKICTIRKIIGKCEIDVPTYDYEAMWKDPEFIKLTDARRGFFLDGGKGYDEKGSGTRCGGNFDDIIWMENDDEEPINT